MMGLRIDLASLRPLHPESRIMNRQVIPSMILSVLIVCFFSVLLYEREKPGLTPANARAASKRQATPRQPQPQPQPRPSPSPSPGLPVGPVISKAASPPLVGQDDPIAETTEPTSSPETGSTSRGEPVPTSRPCLPRKRPLHLAPSPPTFTSMRRRHPAVGSGRPGLRPRRRRSREPPRRNRIQPEPTAAAPPPRRRPQLALDRRSRR